MLAMNSHGRLLILATLLTTSLAAGRQGAAAAVLAAVPPAACPATSPVTLSVGRRETQAGARSQDPCTKPTAALVASGKKVFGGAGNCATCHGTDAKGTPLAPDLTDKTWLNIDGSFVAIAGLVPKGVPQPKSHPAPMPPFGGAQLNNAQVCAVAAYVYSLSHPDSIPKGK